MMTIKNNHAALSAVLARPDQYDLSVEASHSDIPKDILDWLARLKLLYGVPFNYLVPDERMLPPESLRFFVMDENWINCLLDGAYSIGQSTTGSHNADGQVFSRLQYEVRYQAAFVRSANDTSGGKPEAKVISGFLLRSTVVSGWPGLEVTGFPGTPDNPGDALNLLRFDQLSKTVMIGLFCGNGPLQTLSVHEPSEALHFGVEGTPGTLTTTLRYVHGQPPKTQPGEQILDSADQPVTQAIPTRENTNAAKSNRVLKIQKAANEIKVTLAKYQYSGEMTSAEFALEMIKGANEIEFTRHN